MRDLSHENRMGALSAIAADYDEPRFIASPELFFPEPEAIRPYSVHVRDLRHANGEVVDLRWDSAHVSMFSAFHATFAAYENNRTAHARLFLARARESGRPRESLPRPAVVAIHGYLGGAYGFEERAFPVRWMVRRGFDVALVVLPFHAQRARTDRAAAPPFPGADPRFTIEGARQAVHDIRGLVRYLRDRGAPSVGLMGMSLGGYLTSLVATLESDLAFAVPMIPLASFADFARDQGRFGEGPAAADQYRAYDAAMRVISPLARPSKVPPERMLILAGAHDHITPKAHAERLAAHFGARLVVFPGGHLLQIGRGDAFREVGRFWRGLGLGAASHRLA